MKVQDEESALGFTCKSKIPPLPAALGRGMRSPLPWLLQISCKTTLRADLSARPAGTSLHVSYTRFSALSGNGAVTVLRESRQICRILATRKPKLISKPSGHSKRGITKKLRHLTVEVTRRRLPDITLPAGHRDRMSEGASRNMTTSEMLVNASSTHTR